MRYSVEIALEEYAPEGASNYEVTLDEERELILLEYDVQEESAKPRPEAEG